MKQASRNQSYVAPPPQPYSAGPYYGPSPYSAQPPNQLWDWRDYFVSNYTSTYKNTFKLESQITGVISGAVAYGAVSLFGVCSIPLIPLNLSLLWSVEICSPSPTSSIRYGI